MKYKIRKGRTQFGFVVAELLVALAIMGILLAALGAAFNASAINYRLNEDIFKAVNGARLALFRITSQVRTATSVNPDAPANECSLFTADGDDITYRYNSGDKKLYLITDSGNYVLCDNVTAMNFQKDWAIDEDGEPYVKSVQITATVVVGGAERAVSAAAVVRKNLD